jgi:outer membrane protein assembly factor BamB
MGHEEWAIQVANSEISYPISHYVERRGHRAVLFLGTQFRVIDMLRHGQNPRTIVEDVLRESSRHDVLGRQVTQIRLDRMGLRTHWRSDVGPEGFLGNAGPLRDQHFCYQLGGTLIAVDPFDGRELWRVDDLPSGCEIVADEHYVVLVPPVPHDDRQVAHIFQVADGAFVGARPLPSSIERTRRGADWGRLFLTKTKHPGTQDVTLAMFDPVLGDNVWEQRIPQYHSWAPLDGFDLVVLDETGRVQLFDAETGELQLETQTEIPSNVNAISVVGHPHEWFLFSERRPDVQQPIRSVPLHNRPEFHSINGMAYAFDRDTDEQLWSRELLSLYVDPSLPGRWPLLVLSADAYEGSGRSTNRFQNLLLLNKRTGEVVYEGEGSGQGQGQGTSWVVSDEVPQLQLSFGKTGLAVSFRDEPLGEDADATPPPDEDAPAKRLDPTGAPKRRIPSPSSKLPDLGEEM